jgi:Domain of unknown function (DUF4304)
MPKSAFAKDMDELQERLHPLLSEAGFRRHGRTYNRTTEDGLVDVIGYQMGAYDPPGTTYFAGLRENLYGLFTINIGIHVPEVERARSRKKPTKVIHERDCCIRSRVGRGKEKEIWWKVCIDESLIRELRERFRLEAFALFDRFKTRDQVLSEFRMQARNTKLMLVPRIVCAIILLERGQRHEAQALLAAQAADPGPNPHHRQYVTDLASRLGIPIGD